MSSMNPYQKRWSSTGRTTPTASGYGNSLTTSVEPSTTGTSWNSVRWNKPSTSYRANLASRFENKSSYSLSPAARNNNLRYSSNMVSSAAKHAADIVSVSPSVSSRASRFDTSTVAVKDRYRNEARELINKWSSRERNPVESSYKPTTHRISMPEVTTTTGYKSTDSFPYRKSSSLTPTRSSAMPSVSRYSIERASLLSPSPTPSSHTLKMERPWRQRMAESSRIRATLGDDYRSRQSSVESSVFSPSTRFTTAYVPSYTKTTDEKRSSTNMSRSYSPIRSSSGLFKTSSSSRVYSTTKPPEPAARSISPTRDPSESRQYNTVSQAPKNPSIRESSKERDPEKKRNPRSSRERTARRNSRQNSQQQSSSSDEEISRIMRSRSSSKQRKKKRKRSDGFEGDNKQTIDVPQDTLNNKSMNSSIYDTSQEDPLKTSLTSVLPAALADLTQLVTQLTADSEEFLSCNASPLAPPLSRSSSKNGVTKSQIIKSPSLIEVHGLPRSDSKSSIKSNTSDLHDFSYSEEPSDMSRKEDDESQYSAVAYFKKPFKTKRIAPVPGLWKQEPGDEHISKNKSFSREESHASTFIVWKIKKTESVTKKVKVPVKKMEKVAPKSAENNTKKVDEKKEVPKKAVKEPKTSTVKKEAEVEEPPKTTTTTEPVKEESKIKKMFLGRKKKPIEEEKVDEKKEVAKKKEPQNKEPVKKIEPPKEETVQISKAFSQSPKTYKTELVFAIKRNVDITHPKKIKAVPTLRTTSMDQNFAKPATPPATVRKTIKEKRKEMKKCTLKCKASSTSNIQQDDHFRRRPVHERATVIVDTPVKDVNISRAKLRCREKRRSLPAKIEHLIEPTTADQLETVKIPTLEVVASTPRTRSQNEQKIDDHSRSMSRSSHSRAAEVLDEMRNVEAAVEWTRDSSEDEHDRTGLLILPDQSILEDYVNRKRGKLERHRLHRPSSICSSRGYESSGCESPCNSTISELYPPSSIRVHEPSPRGLPVITTPSRLSSVEASTPTNMLETSTYNNFNSTPQAFNKNGPNRLQIAKPIQFDPPKSPFEERLQQQAKKVRKSSIASTLSAVSDNETRDQSPRRGSQGEGMAAISQQFTQAASANPAPGRYAAHIPVNRQESSGRASAASVDSTNSGALDTATKKLDHVIDQARHRHHQHRSKFKEAIDYLDQIFEDLKKECDVNGEDKNNNDQQQKENKIVKAEPVIPEKKTTVIKPTVVRKTSNGNSNSLPTRSQKHRPVHPPSPVEVVIPVKKVSATSDPEPTVAETIVLPKKTDKLDFTRRWLQDDLSSLAHMPPPNIAPTASMYQDCDEHSLGSCSAEVAAINTKKEKKKSNGSSSHHQKPQKTEDPIRPRPFRPQPVYGIPGSSNSNSFPLELDPSLGTSSSLPRVASFDRVSDNLRRSGSQDPYNTLHSMRSDEGSTRPSPSAFQHVNSFSGRGSMRSSMRSLPDHSPVRGRYLQPEAARDPVLAIDQLVAELELNTDQPMSSVDKRRSFPTSFGRQQNEYEQPTRHRAELRHAPARGRVQGYAAPSAITAQSLNNAQLYAQPQPSKRRPAHSQQNSLDEVTNLLGNIVSQMTPPNKQNLRKQQSQPPFVMAPGHGPNAFETINQEKINPSRVEAMHNMFERGTDF